MRKAFSLIELIFTVVIAAIIFTVIPKIIFAINKSDNLAIRQDAMFNAVSLMGIITKLPWDENNTAKTDILKTDSANITFECNSSTNFRRYGGFISLNGRDCKKQINASSISVDTDEDNYFLYDDIDDFNQATVEANVSTSKKKYNITTTVRYLTDDNNTIFNYDYVNRKVIIQLNNAAMKTSPSNIKHIKTTVSYAGGRGKEKNITSFNYYSTNIGQLYLNKRVW